MSDVKEGKLSPSRQKIVDEIITAMEKGGDHWKQTWRSFSRPVCNFASGRNYSGLNAFLLTFYGRIKGKTDFRWGTFNQIKEKGFRLKAGSKAAPIEVYQIIDKRYKKPADMVKIQKELAALSVTEQLKWRRENLYTMIKTYSLFNGDDVEGLPAAQVPTFKSGESDARIERVEKIMAGSEAKILNDGGCSAYYAPLSDTIHLPLLSQFENIEDYYATALHEIAHSTGHESRLNRNLVEVFTDKSAYALEELRAEISSVLLQNELGSALGQRLDNHAAYLNGWASVLKNSPDELFKAIKDADCITNYVLALEAQRAQEKPQNLNEAEEAEHE